MRRGFWHQFGDRSQRMALEQIEMGNGVGVIISPRDLSYENAKKYCLQYKNLGADILIDLQFYNPTFSNNLFNTYPISVFRQSLSSLGQLNQTEFGNFANKLREINSDLNTSAILAPALVYEAARNDIFELNARLLSLSKKVGDELGIPTYSTIMLGKSVTVSETLILNTLSSATKENCDGYYFGFEFEAKRLPSTKEEIKRFGLSLLNLAGTGKEILHSFAGPLSILSLAFGASATAVGHSQNLWQFSRGRWETSDVNGGGGDAPARYFSTNLWGTFVYPDELFNQLLTDNIRNSLLTPTPFSSNLDSFVSYPWDRWTSNKHLLFSIGTMISRLSSLESAHSRALSTQMVLNSAVNLINDITNTGIVLKDNTCIYQDNWLKAVSEILTENEEDYDFLSLISS